MWGCRCAADYYDDKSAVNFFFDGGDIGSGVYSVAQKIEIRTGNTRRGPELAQEKIRHADYGRSYDLVRSYTGDDYRSNYRLQHTYINAFADVVRLWAYRFSG